MCLGYYFINKSYLTCWPLRVRVFFLPFLFSLSLSFLCPYSQALFITSHNTVNFRFFPSSLQSQVKPFLISIKSLKSHVLPLSNNHKNFNKSYPILSLNPFQVGITRMEVNGMEVTNVLNTKWIGIHWFLERVSFFLWWGFVLFLGWDSACAPGGWWLRLMELRFICFIVFNVECWFADLSG